MLNIYIFILTAIVFAFCSAVIIHQLIYARYFRNKIAKTHGFFEGIMTGMSYPMLWISYGLIAVQFICFIAFKTDNELFLTIRLILFALSILLFCIFKALTPTLLAYWFKKNAFWDARGEAGRHSYKDIYCAKVYKDKDSNVINNQQIYKISFYVKGKTAFLIPKKYICRMTAKEISTLTPYINFKDRTAKPYITKKALLYTTLMPILVLFITLCCFFQTVSSGILNSEKYSYSSSAYENEISTITEITEVKYDENKIYVVYGKIGAVNIYTPAGELLYSVSLPHSIFKNYEIAVKEGRLYYHFGDELYTYSESGLLLSTEPYGENHSALFSNKDTPQSYGDVTFGQDGVFINGASGTVTVVKRPAYLALFSTSFVWPINIILILALFMLRYYVMKKPSDLSSQKPSNAIC